MLPQSREFVSSIASIFLVLRIAIAPDQLVKEDDLKSATCSNAQKTKKPFRLRIREDDSLWEFWEFLVSCFFDLLRE